MLVRELKRLHADLLIEQKRIKEQLKVFQHVKKGTIIYSEDHEINISQDGVSGWLTSYQPTILMCTDWVYKDRGYAINYKILATEDIHPYESPYQTQYSGIYASMYFPMYRGSSTIKIVPKEDLPLYIHFKHKTVFFDRLLKGTGI